MFLTAIETTGSAYPIWLVFRCLNGFGECVTDQEFLLPAKKVIKEMFETAEKKIRHRLPDGIIAEYVWVEGALVSVKELPDLQQLLLTTVPNSQEWEKFVKELEENHV